jgi:hypothetical protein
MGDEFSFRTHLKLLCFEISLLLFISKNPKTFIGIFPQNTFL